MTKTIPKKFTPLSPKQKDGVARMMAQDKARKEFDELGPEQGQQDGNSLAMALSKVLKKRKVQ